MRNTWPSYTNKPIKMTDADKVWEIAHKTWKGLSFKRNGELNLKLNYHDIDKVAFDKIEPLDISRATGSR